jgi:imidazolonepropionase-like amidohydrolase
MAVLERSRVDEIRNARILDVTTGEIGDPANIRIEDGLIVDVGRSPSASSTAVLDADGQVVMPGLIDCHVHLYAGTGDLAAVERWPSSTLVATAAQELSATLARGFTTVRDVAGADLGLANAVRDGKLPGPRIVPGGMALSQTGGHGDMRRPGDPDCHHSSRFIVLCDGPDEVRKAAREQFRQGAAHLKMMLGGGVVSPSDPLEGLQYTEAEILAAVEEANQVGRYVVGHAYTDASISRAVRCGVRTIEHGNLMGRATAELMAEHDAFLVPTLITYEALHDQVTNDPARIAQRQTVATIREAGLRSLEYAKAAGVRIAFGTDLLGDTRHRQLEEFIMRRDVQTPLEQIQAATSVAAELLGDPAGVGHVRAGAKADLLVLDSNPLTDILVLTRPAKHLAAVIKDGDLVISAK